MAVQIKTNGEKRKIEGVRDLWREGGKKLEAHAERF